LPYPQRLSDIEAGVAQVAETLGREGSGKRILARIADLRRTAPQRPIETVWLGGGGRSVGAKGLAADWMRLAGLRQRPLQGDRISLEQLLVSPPPLLLRSDYRNGQYSGEQRWLSHPLAKVTRKPRTVLTDGRQWTCLGPAMIGEIMRLRRVLHP
jgi:iron complex transport system substrate-binding protein